jgi:tetratricopeptide (TPR) repeat protein
MLDDARRLFESIVSAEGNGARGVRAGAFVNLGNVAYLSARYAEAYDYYGKALELQPENAAALLGYARASRELGKGKDATSALDRLRAIAPELAEKHAYLGGASIADRSAGADKEVSSWSED